MKTPPQELKATEVPVQELPAMEPKAKSGLKPILRPLHRRIFLGMALVLLLAGLSAAGYAFAYSTRIVPRVSISGVPVGGLTRAQAKDALQRRQSEFSKVALHLTYADKSWDLTPAQLGVSFSNDPALDAAFSRGHSGSFGTQVRQLFSAPFFAHFYQAGLNGVSRDPKGSMASQVLTKVESPAKETSLDLVPGHVTVVPGTPGSSLDYDALDARLYSVFAGASVSSLSIATLVSQPTVSVAQAEAARVLADSLLASDWTLVAGDVSKPLAAQTLTSWLDVRPVSGSLQVSLKEEVVRKAISDFGTMAKHAPANAVLRGENGGIIVAQPDHDGVAVQEDITLSSFKQFLLVSQPPAQHVLTASVATVRADIRADNFADLGIRQLIGSATTDFAGSPGDRTANINVGQRALNGIIVKDGETFSTIAHLSPIDASTGYVPGLIISNGRTYPDYGGGLCQVSTTLFRATLSAGLPIVERTNHSYRVSYYERGVGPGLDATIYDPNPDFKWKNDTGHAMMVQSYVKGTQVTFELYGTSDGRVATIGAPQILATYPVGDPIYADSDTLFVGQTKQLETAHDGASTRVNYSVSRGGQVIYDKDFNSYYQAWPARYLRGTKP